MPLRGTIRLIESGVLCLLILLMIFPPRSVFLFLFVITCCAIFVFPVHSQEALVKPALRAQPVRLEQPAVTAASVYSVDASNGRVIYSKNISEKRPVASTQKLLTGLIIAEGGNLDERIPVASTDRKVSPRNLWLTEGSSYRRGTLLEAMLVRSFNDSAKCLARTHSGSQAEFARTMNARAEKLGMKDSHFVNAHGLTEEGQYSTAHDMILLAAAAWMNPEVRRIVQLKGIDFTYEGAKTIQVKNSNELLHTYAPCVGMKTGYTEAAGRCLVAAATRGERTVLAVILGSKFEDVWTDAETVLEWSLKH